MSLFLRNHCTPKYIKKASLTRLCIFRIRHLIAMNCMLPKGVQTRIITHGTNSSTSETRKSRDIQYRGVLDIPRPEFIQTKMEKARTYLRCSEEDAKAVSELSIPKHKLHSEASFYEDFALRGIKLDRIDEHGVIYCSFKVAPRLAGRDGKLAAGAIAYIVDEVGAAAVHIEGLPMNVSVNMSISYISTANVNDELEIISRALGRRGGCLGTSVLLRNKATGDIIAEGRHTLFSKHHSKL